MRQEAQMTVEPLAFDPRFSRTNSNAREVITRSSMMVSERVNDPCAPRAARCLPRHVTMTSGAAGGHAVHESGPMPEQTPTPP